MTVQIVHKQVVGEAKPRKAPPTKMTTQQIAARVRSMAVGDLMISYPEMSLAEAQARIAGAVVCNQLHATAISLDPTAHEVKVAA